MQDDDRAFYAAAGEVWRRERCNRVECDRAELLDLLQEARDHTESVACECAFSAQPCDGCTLVARINAALKKAGR